MPFQKAFVFFTLFLFLVDSASASVVGTWSVKANVNVKVTLTGKTSRSASGRAVERFTFYEDGSFTQLSGVSGTWTQNGKKLRVELNRDDFRQLFDRIAGAYRITVSEFGIVRADIVGKEARKGTRMTGAVKVKMRGLGLNVRGKGVKLSVSSTSQFTGKRASEQVSNALSEAEHHTDILEHVLRSVTEEADVFGYPGPTGPDR